MDKNTDGLFSSLPHEARATGGNGVLPDQALRRLLQSGVISGEEPVTDAQIQPASIDLRLGKVAHRVRASFLPGPHATIEDKIDIFGMHTIDLTKGAVLERGCVYIVPLMERLALGDGLSGLANPKSSTGRLDVFTRLITDYAPEFERVRPGYRGPLYAEVSPRTFSIVVRTGTRLNQLRLKHGAQGYTEEDLSALHGERQLIDRMPEDFVGGLPITVDLAGTGDGLVGWKAKPHAGLIDVELIDHYEPHDYWEPVRAPREGGVILDPSDFYILASKEAVRIPADHAAEMVAYDTLVGEFRAHYAGFFDPGFGDVARGADGTRAVLEVRSHDVPFVIENGQTIGRLIFERLTEPAGALYGAGIGSSYQRQGLALSKQFKR